MIKETLKAGGMNNFLNLDTLSTINMIKNTKFDNQVNYDTYSSSGTMYLGPAQSSSDPRSLTYLMRNNQIILFKLAMTTQKVIKQTIQEKK